MPVENVVKEEANSDLKSSTGDEDPSASVSSKDSPNRTASILPHIAIPFPSTPNIAGLIHFLHYHANRRITEDTDDKKASRSPSVSVNPRRLIRVRPKNRRAPPPRAASSTSNNKPELTRATSSYPESLNISGHRPNTRLNILVHSIPVPSMPKLRRPKDPFECLSGGDVVLLGGYQGSILRDAKTKKMLWVPLVRACLNLRKVNLAIPLDEDADEHTEATVVPDGILTKLGPFDFSNKLVTKLRQLEKQGKCRVHLFDYDWRISPHLISQRFQEFLQRLPCNHRGMAGQEASGALVLAHSMGGLIAHHVLQSKPHLFSGVVYCSTPFLHCVNILGSLKRGELLFANRDILSAAVNFSMRSSFIFLPESGEFFINRRTRENYILDFFDSQTWVEYGLSPCVSDVGLTPDHASRSLHPTKASCMPVTRRRSLQDDVGLEMATYQTEKSAMTHSQRYLEPHMQSVALDCKNYQPRDKREHAIEYLKRTLEQTRKYKRELFAEPTAAIPPIAVVYAVNTPTVRGALVESTDDIKTGNWWNLSYGPGDGVVLAKAAQLPSGFSAVARIKTHQGHVQIMNDLKAIGAAIEAVILAKRNQEVEEEEYESDEVSVDGLEEAPEPAPVEMSGLSEVFHC